MALLAPLLTFSAFDNAPRHADAAEAALRINSGGPQYQASNGATWAADEYATDGRAVSYTRKVSGTSDDAVYQDQRVGMSAYDIPVSAAATYRVTLGFADLERTGRGERVFDVTAEGIVEIDNLDIVARFGRNRPGTAAFDVNVADGTLDLGFVAHAGEATVATITVERVDATTATTSSTSTTAPTTSTTSAPTTTVAPSTSTTLAPASTTTTAPPPAAASTGSTKLTWAPPALSNPTTIVVTNSNHQFTLDQTKDYVLDLPPNRLQSTPLRGSGLQNRTDSTALVVNGGHNVVIIGGHITVPQQNIPRWGLTGTQVISGTQGTEENLIGIAMRRAAAFANITGTLHVEGVLVDGEDLAEGFQFNMPSGVAQIQNVRIENMHARDETSFTDNHPDHFDNWGGVKEERVDRFTGETDYQSLKAAGTQRPVQKVVWKHVNIRPRPTTLGAYYIWSTGADGIVNYPQSFTDVWLQPRSGRSFRDTVYHPNIVTVSTDATGQYLTSTSSLWTGLVRNGVPPSGDFVPVGVAGDNYVSPGYL